MDTCLNEGGLGSIFHLELPKAVYTWYLVYSRLGIFPKLKKRVHPKIATFIKYRSGVELRVIKPMDEKLAAFSGGKKPNQPNGVEHIEIFPSKSFELKFPDKELQLTSRTSQRRVVLRSGNFSDT